MSIAELSKQERKVKKINPIFRIIFSRLLVTIGLVVFQFFLLLYFGKAILSGPISIVISVLNVIVGILIVNRSNQKAEYKLIWLIIIGLIPGGGVLLYLVLNINRHFGINIKELMKNNKHIYTYLEKDYKSLMEALPEQEKQYINLQCDMSYIPYNNCEIRYLKNGVEYFDALFEELEKAKEVILMEYFIISDGLIWQNVLKILERKIEEGVKVYLMYDGLNSLFSFSPQYFNDLKKKGLKMKMFAPIIPFISYSQNARDHRKVVVIDNKVAITGGINLADEYANLITRFGHWQDSGILLKGDIALSFASEYIQLYNLRQDDKSKVSIDTVMQINNNHLTPITVKDEKDDSYAVSIGDYPWTDYHMHERLYKTMINTATKEVYINTPYLIIDSTMMDTVKIAADRGIHITFIVPHIPDKAYAFILTRSFFKELLECGCDIYEYTPGFIHQKVCVADDNRAYVGTCNFDYRSLYLHYENGVYIYKDKCILDIKNDIMDIINRSQKITLEDVKKFKFTQKFFGPILRIFAPMM